MPLTYDWSVLATALADLKALVSATLDARLTAVEARPEPTPYDDTALKTRVAELETAVSANGTDDASVLARVVALESAVNALSEQLASYASSAPPPTEPAPTEPPA